jgi:pimeloyl-ACP methyl ester carboxylesterase
VDEVELAMDSLRPLRGFRRFAAVGLCAGAFWAFHTALRRRDLSAAILINPLLLVWDPAAARRRILRHTLRGLTNRATGLVWLMAGLRPQDLKRAARTPTRWKKHGR